MATTNTNIVRATKIQKFDAIINLLNGNPAIVIPDELDKNGTVKKTGFTMDAEYLIEFIESEKALLTRKNSGENKKQTATQKENEAYKERILAYLGTQTEGKTCTDIRKSIPEFTDFENQKIASLMRQLVESGRVEKNTVKGKSVFSLA